MICSSVDLPLPLMPTSAAFSPGSKSSVTSRSNASRP
jgi:hypothetical protein